MADTPPPTPSAPVVRPSKPVSEALLNEKWDHAISSLLIRSSLGLSFGVVFSVLLFKRRAWPAWVGLGFGAGRAWEEADGYYPRYPPDLYVREDVGGSDGLIGVGVAAMFKRGDAPTGREGLRMVRPS